MNSAPPVCPTLPMNVQSDMKVECGLPTTPLEKKVEMIAPPPRGEELLMNIFLSKMFKF